MPTYLITNRVPDGFTPSPEAGEATSGSVMPAGSTCVTVAFKPEGPGTRLTLTHDRLPNIDLETGHKIAWGTYLPRLVIHIAGGDPGSDPHAWGRSQLRRRAAGSRARSRSAGRTR